jgi:hypothetical protein
MNIAEVPLLTILVAVTGPLGITLGWWLGRRSERERASREERKTAYGEFIRAIVDFRSTEPDKRPEIRDDRYASMTALILIAPPAVFQAAWALVTVQDRLLDDPRDDQLQRVQDEIWARFSRFASMARTDLGVRENPFGTLRPETTRSGPPMLDMTLMDSNEAGEIAQN